MISRFGEVLLPVFLLPSCLPSLRSCATGEGLKTSALALTQQPSGLAFLFARRGASRTVLAISQGPHGIAYRDTLELPAEYGPLSLYQGS